MALQARTEGTGRGASTGDWVLSSDAIDSIISKRMRNLQVHFSRNAEAYANARVAKGRDPEPRYIISGEGLTNHPQKFGWSYLPPASVAYKVWPKGQTRPWSWIMLHSFGYTWDYYWMARNRRRTRLPGDAYGHHPNRWFGAVRQLCGLSDPTRPKKERVSIHFCISRKGDVLCSCDLNDLAYHGGGDFQIKAGGNNKWTIGFELEPELARYQYANGSLSQPYILPYTDRQMLALAIVCKKLKTIRPEVEDFYASKQNGSVKSQVAAHTGGYLQHKDVFSKKVDANAQFDILTGQRGTASPNPFMKGLQSGWDQLWGLMAKLRFNLATDVFIKDLKKNEFESLTDLSVAMMKTNNAGQRAVIQKNRDRLMALRRASSMQAQDRRALYKNALGHTTTMSDIVAKSTTQVAKQANQFSASGVKGVSGDVQAYDFETGTWAVGGSDTGKAV